MNEIFDDEIIAVLATLNAAGCGIDDNGAIGDAVRPFVPDLDIDGLTPINVWESNGFTCDFVSIPGTNAKLMCTVDGCVTWTGGLIVGGELHTYCL